MDKKKGLLNITTSLVFKLIIIIASIFVRRMIIKYVGNEINGLNALFTSIIGVLGVAELGVGAAITFCMYKPIVDGDTPTIAALYRTFWNLYFIIGGVVLLCGCALMPALPFFAKDYDIAGVNIYLSFGLVLISVFISYVFSAKTSLINAHKNDFITTIISSCSLLLQYGLQIFVLYQFQSFVAFLICQIFAMIIQFIAIKLVVRKKYTNIIKTKSKLNAETKNSVVKNIKAMFAHKIGHALVNGVDSIIISAVLGVAVLGFYTNYTTIMVSMVNVIALVFTAMTSVVGHALVESNDDSKRRYFDFFHVLNFILGCVFFLGYYAVIDNLVTLLFGKSLEVAKSISIVITINYFIQFMRQSIILFRDASGTFYYDRWRPIVEGVLNIGLSIGFVYLFNYLWGANFAVVGVIVATILTNLAISLVVEPFVLFKYTLNTSPIKFYVKNYYCIAIFVCILFALHFSMIKSDNQWVELFANGGISLAYSLTVLAVVVLINKDFRHYAKNFLLRLNRHKDNRLQTVVATSGAIADQTVEDANVSNENSISINEDVNSDVAVKVDKDSDNVTNA